MLRLWMRWSWRDLRGRWIQVVAIALIIALGTGTYAGLTSSSRWREISNEASFRATRMFDLRVRLAAGEGVAAGTLLDALTGLRHPDWVAEAEERLILPTQVDASTPERSIFVPGRLIGVDTAGGGPHVNRLHVTHGEALPAGGGAVLLERNFAKHYDLPDQGRIRIAGGVEIPYVGQATTPEYFLVVTDEGAFFAQANFAAVFTSLETAQQLAGRPGEVNDLVLTLTGDADLEQAAAEVAAATRPLGGSLLRQADDPSFRILTEDVEGDQQFVNVFALAVFAGAVFAAFNLTTRMVEAERREIGVAMALGAPPSRIAIRPLLVGAQIALLGVVFGIGVGLAIGEALRNVFADFIPLPVWRTPFQTDLFVWVAVGGFVIPLLAIAYPVWRAVRVAPLEAIKPTHLSMRGARLAGRLPAPWTAGTFLRMPIRNLSRAPRRVLLTALGVAAVVAVLTSVVGMLDSFLDTLDRGEEELLGDSPDRLNVELERFVGADDAEIAAIRAAPGAGRAEAALRVGATLVGTGDRTSIDVVLQLRDLESELWQPTLDEAPGAEGVVIAEKAASDLDLRVGDFVVLRHPVRGSDGTFSLTDTRVPVSGVHPNPFRFIAFMDWEQAPLFGLTGLANLVVVEPSGVSPGELQRELFQLPGVASVQPVRATTDLLRDMITQSLDVLRVVEVGVILLAVLIAFNAASLNTDERRREHATMFAFGVSVRRVLAMAVLEHAILGVIATVLGLAGGYALLGWLIEEVTPRTLPDIAVRTVLAPESIGIGLLLGVAAVAVAPLFMIRRLRRMNVPAALRVME